MKSMKFYIYFSNIAILVFSLIFIGIGVSQKNYVLLTLGAALIIYGILRLYRMLKALKQRDDTLDEEG